jgi:hypothetical protein
VKASASAVNSILLSEAAFVQNFLNNEKEKIPVPQMLPDTISRNGILGIQFS